MKSIKRLTQRAVTIKDVAREAGVSAMSVSNVLNGRGRISEATADSIRRTVERLGYRPSVAARRLRLSQQWTIGMLIVVDDPDFLNDPFITAQVTGLTNYLTANSYSLILRGMRPSDFRTARVFQDIEADGMVAILSGEPMQREWFVRELSALRIPLVFLQEQETPKDMDCIVIRQDDFDGGRQVGLHLVENGARDCWMLMPCVEWAAMRSRLEGLSSMFAEAGLQSPTIIRCKDESFDICYLATLDALRHGRRPDAIVGGNDRMAIGAMKACIDTGIRIPGDVQVMGFNAFDTWRYVEPTLTTVRSAAHDLGERAARELMSRLQTGRFRRRKITLPVTLQPGKSTRQTG
ncbi:MULTISPECIES: LacI family DNA-binding transcriptional regulator [unclassified Mesorhizobium]|uniref:LacI family DNA-binding transcriptional regulator n=1 Tax=unclassified Mesorhizobium TaxID=325217 RepID=UPI001676B5D1|nr:MULTISPECIES: LacI family DNA-binding transcriptional regulator [unclassified Mesorhizobium]